MGGQQLFFSFKYCMCNFTEDLEEDWTCPTELSSINKVIIIIYLLLLLLLLLSGMGVKKISGETGVGDFKKIGDSDENVSPSTPDNKWLVPNRAIKHQTP